ncbi:hypothetical protein [Parasphingorhabdus sp.]|uniref:hypothetical protein n=1 Tax=Parasphingorhabdus sp. TaxID=2709688 RepID=UPI003593BA07
MTDIKTEKKTNWLIWIFAAFGLAGVVAVIFIAISIANIGGSNQQERTPLAVVDGQIEYRMGQVIDLQGNDQSAITIISNDRNGSSGSYSSKSYRENVIHNIIFFDRDSEQSRKLLSDNSGSVIAAVFLPDQETGLPLAIGTQMDDASDAAEAAALAAMEAAETTGAPAREQYKRSLPLKHYLAIVAQRDGEIIATKLLVGRLSDGKQALTLEGVESLERFWILSPMEVGLLVQQSGELFHHIVNFGSLSITRSTKIEVN